MTTPAAEPDAPRLDRPATRGGHMLTVLALGALGAGAVLVWTSRPTSGAANDLRAPARPRVRTAALTAGDTMAKVRVLGVARPAEVTTIIARQSGYVADLPLDLGDRVERGQLVATIAAAELAADVRASRAAVTAAEETATLAALTQARARGLASTGAISTQELELAEADLKRARAALGSARADAGRRSALAGYQRIDAPMAGVVVRRLVDPGALAVAGQTPLLQLADASQLDVELEIPQALARGVTVGMPVELGSRDLGPRKVAATITRTSGVIDPTTRTMRAEVRVPADAGIMPGATVEAYLASRRAAAPLLVSARALAARPDGVAVAIVDSAGVVRWQPVEVWRDLGKEVELAPAPPALVAGVRVVLGAPPTLADGDVVEIAPDPPPPPKAAGSGSAAAGGSGAPAGARAAAPPR
jgi:membrane fusion protein (multidrug efflux system)